VLKESSSNIHRLIIILRTDAQTKSSKVKATVAKASKVNVEGEKGKATAEKPTRKTTESKAKGSIEKPSRMPNGLEGLIKYRKNDRTK